MKTKAKLKDNKDDVVFEIGIEELPTPYFDCVYTQKEKVCDYLRSFDIGFEGLDIFITPRRIVFHLRDVAPRTLEKEELIKGPSYEKAFDADGKPTKALEGFLRGKGAALKDIIKIDDGKRESVALKKSSGGEEVSAALKNALGSLISNFTFPRTMAWNDSKARFPRPIRWLFCMYGEAALAIECAGLIASCVTYGHRYIAPGALSCKSAADYFAQVKRHKIILSEEKRKDSIRIQLSEKSAEHSFDSTRFNPELIDTAARLSENPCALVGDFSNEYLSLPGDVLATCMKKHQKIFACYTKKGSLCNHFIAFLDGARPKKALKLIKNDYENVLDSRLRDAAFFIREDTKTSLEAKYEKLRDVVFLGKLGSLYDKSERLAVLSAALARESAFASGEHLDESATGILEAASRLCKVDLLTHLIYEFPELQGIAGREYLKAEGKPEELYQAVSDHYLPRTLSDEIEIKKYKNINVGRIAALLGIADRFDTIVGAFATGIELSGSEDPYALRRASGGIIKLIRAFSVSFSVSVLFEKTYSLLKESPFREHVRVPYDTLYAALVGLLKDRIIYELRLDSGSTERMILDAVLASSCDDIGDVFVRFDSLQKMFRNPRSSSMFKKACKVIERSGNILKSSTDALDDGTIECALFQDPLEHKVFELLSAKQAEIGDCIAQNDYEGAMSLYALTFFDTLHQFFDKVMIHVEEEKVRKNRLLLMKSINELITKEVADLGLIHGVSLE
jgi:glycyl-tRNA synthetase beta chain